MTNTDVIPENETEAIAEQITEEARRFNRIRHVGRHVLAGATGLSMATGMTYLGYKIGTDIVGPQNDTNEAMRYAGIALPTAVLGGVGILGGFYVAVAIAPNENFPSRITH